MGTLLLLLLAQAGPVPAAPQVPIAIVVSSRRDTGNTVSSALCARLKQALAAQGIEAMSEEQSNERLAKLGAIDSHACDGSKLCLAKLADLLKGIVIGVDIGKVQKFSAAHLEAVATGRLESVAVADFTSDAKGWAKKSAEESGPFIAQVAAVANALNQALLAAAEAAKVAAAQPTPDAPQEVRLLPEAPPTPPPVLVEAPRPRGPVAYVVGGAAVVVAVVAVTMLVLGTLDSQRYHQSQSALAGGVTSSFTHAQLGGIASSANLEFSVALGTGIGAAALGVVTGVLFAREP